jgi:hypothetical protein
MSRVSLAALATFFLLICIAIAGSYWRFMHTGAYQLEYEASCDVETEQCFQYVCDPEAEDPSLCEVPPFKLVTKHASDYQRECGDSIVDCTAAQSCLEEDRYCSVMYCDADTVTSDTECVSPEESLEL